MATTDAHAPRRGFRPPEKTSARELRRAIIESSPRRYETDADGRTWVVVRLPDPGEIWVAHIPAEALNGGDPDYNPLDGDPDTTQAPAGQEAPARRGRHSA